MALETDYRIAKQAKLKPILEIAFELGIPAKCIEMYGPYKAKVRLEALQELAPRPNAKIVVVTAITPTPLGEGKTVDRKSTRLNSSHIQKSRMPSSA